MTGLGCVHACTHKCVCVHMCDHTCLCVRLLACAYFCGDGVSLCVELLVWRLTDIKFPSFPEWQVPLCPILSSRFLPSLLSSVTPSCVSRQNHLNWFSFEKKTKAALSKLQMLLAVGKSITISQIC